MHLSTSVALTALALSGLACASAWAGEDGGPALRLPGETGVQIERRPLLVEHSRSALVAHWRPWTLGRWSLGATMGLHRALPGADTRHPEVAAMPMLSYEQPHYRVSLGLVPPRGDRASALTLGLTLPLR